MNTCYSGRSSRPARLFSFRLLDGPQGITVSRNGRLTISPARTNLARFIHRAVRVARSRRRDFGLSRFTTAFMNKSELWRWANDIRKRCPSCFKFSLALVAKSFERHLIINEDRRPNPTSFTTAHVLHGYFRCLHETSTPSFRTVQRELSQLPRLHFLHGLAGEPRPARFG
jgi:hypothetical protein